MTEQVFTGLGFTFTRVSDGYEALGRLLSEPFDLLITGKQLPRLDGLALIGALRLSNSINRKIPTILLTSSEKHEFTRATDPDFVVFKDSSLVGQLTGIARDVEFLLEGKATVSKTKH